MYYVIGRSPNKGSFFLFKREDNNPFYGRELIEMIDTMLKRLEKAKWDNENLFMFYNHMATECYDKKDMEEYAYWIERAYSSIEEKRRIIQDINKLKGES